MSDGQQKLAEATQEAIVRLGENQRILSDSVEGLTRAIAQQGQILASMHEQLKVLSDRVIELGKSAD
ncbi:MAG: hypothetical protein J0I48_05320 [Devosia sp.]|uniref:hypothetical protein n=1 Tax=Devosia sp. 66-22 TaxID=1895753 RepID=UPI000927E216|nr:hypothetical protein [Devosia sp. 66-22]MBN9345613.1 hypothetical protein [Devosia sp.]OJX50688.1 MAG: hypothetical protein BGO81_20790 [Devosia sp. 66-22]